MLARAQAGPRLPTSSLLSMLSLALAVPAAPAASPLELVRTIPLKGPTGRLDHLALAKGKRLFVANLSNNRPVGAGGSFVLVASLHRCRSLHTMQCNAAWPGCVQPCNHATTCTGCPHFGPCCQPGNLPPPPSRRCLSTSPCPVRRARQARRSGYTRRGGDRSVQGGRRLSRGRAPCGRRSICRTKRGTRGRECTCMPGSTPRRLRGGCCRPRRS
jgi:hypothetical protein